MEFKNIFTSAEFRSSNYSFKYFSFLWTIVLLLPLIYFPLPSILFGHPWKVELVISLFLALSLTYLFLRFPIIGDFTALSSQAVLWVITPFGFLIFWSATSVFWAGSALSVIHHTLVWFCYLLFFIFAIQIVNNKKLFILSIFSLSAIIGIIAALCIIEYTLATQITDVFGFRYGRFAEMHASVLPLFFSFVLRFKKKHLVWAILITILIWLALIFSLSRGALLSAIVGLSVFILLRTLTHQTYVERKRLVLAAAGIILLAILAQIPLFSSNQQSQNMLARLNVKDDDPANSIQRNIRLLFNGVGLEMFKSNALVGVGADNFGLEFNKYRALFSSKIENKAVAEQKEELFPERAHNEYLQILAELGIVGGGLFAWMILGVFRLEFNTIKSDKFLASNILNHAAIAGMIAFFCSSLFSSFSFRLMQNGLIFFFLLAILLKKYFIKKNLKTRSQSAALNRWIPTLALITIGLCLSLTVFSTLKAASQFLTFQAERQKDFETAKWYFTTAKMFDPANAAAAASYGFLLRSESKFDESEQQFKEAVAKGLNPIGCYSYLISSEILANDFEGAKKTASETVEIFPYSVFARVRYSSLLKKFNMESESAKQFEIARELNKKQAETWQMLINEGGVVTVEKMKSNVDILPIDRLIPNDAVFAVLSERQILHPEENIKLNLND